MADETESIPGVGVLYGLDCWVPVIFENCWHPYPRVDSSHQWVMKRLIWLY